MFDGAFVHPGAIAVDPRLFHIGSRYILVGRIVRAEDTGSMIIGHHVDLWMYSCSDAFKWGVRREYMYGV